MVSSTRENIEFGYFAAHEQYSPEQLLEHVMLAERSGFSHVWTSDHFHPWAHSNAHGGQAWVWIGAALSRTNRAKIGTAITAPGYKYHPALIAQAFATLDNLYPGRVFLTLGTGESMNESPLGFPWPRIKVRQERLEEAILIIKSLWENDFVTHAGKYFRLKKANLYTKPQTKIPLYVAANGPKTAYIAGALSDGLLTLPSPLDNYRNELFPALEKGAKDSKKDPSKVKRIIEIVISYNKDFDKAVKSCRFWAGALIPFFFNYDVFDPREIEQVGRMISDEEISKRWLIVSSAEEAIKRIQEYVSVGFSHIQFLSSSPDEEEFIQVFSKQVLPVFSSK